MSNNKNKNHKKRRGLSPHDRYLRSVMMNPRVARDFFEKNLPLAIRSKIDLDTIELQKESFINDKLRLQVVDLLYSVNIQEEPGYLYLLLEHASTPQRLLPFRMLKYMIAIMDHHLTKTGGTLLPVVYPLILYTGKQPFNHSLDLFTLFETNKPIALTIYRRPYQLIDLTHASDEELTEYQWFRMAALFAKHIHDKDMLPFLKVIMKQLRKFEKEGELDYIYLSLSYVVEAGEVSDRDEFFETIIQGLAPVDEDKIMTIAEQLRKEGFEQAMTIAEQLRKEGFEQAMAIAEQLRKEGFEQAMTIAEQLRKESFEQGKAQGIEKGKAEGKEQGSAEERVLIAKNMLADKLSLDTVAKFTGLPLEVLKRFKR